MAKRCRKFLVIVEIADIRPEVDGAVVWPEATGGTPDPIRLIAALAAFLAGLRFGVVWAIIAGMGTLYLMQFLLS